MENPTITITTISPEHWQQFKDIRLEALSADPQAFEQTYEEVLQHPDSYWMEHLADPNYVVLFAKTPEDVVGMIGVHFKSVADEGNIAVLWGLYVAKHLRGQGIGKKLLLEAMNQVAKRDGVEKVKLCVMEHQKIAEGLYESCGFAETGRKEDAVETDSGYSDEILMEKTL